MPAPAAREVFEEVDEALGQNLSRIMREGPEDELTLTENAQPAIMANAIAVLRVLEKEGRAVDRDQRRASASPAIRSANIPRCARPERSRWPIPRGCSRLRGQAMQAAVPVRRGGDGALLGPTWRRRSALADAAAEGEVCQVANDNDPGQVVPRATGPRSSARWRWPGITGSSAG